MLSSFSSNVILAKARAMYGRSLKTQDYQALINCHTVGEVASYLKNNTSYSEALAQVNLTDVHRSQLENALKRKLLFDFASLSRYEISVSEHFSNYLIIRSEIEQIMHALLLLSAGKPEEYLFSMPAYLDAHTVLDLKTLSHIKSYDDLLAVVAHSPYKALLMPFAPRDGNLNLTGIENALYTHLYRYVFNTIDHHASAGAAKELRGIFNDHIDLCNFVRIVRQKLYFHAHTDTIRSSLLPFGTFSDAILSQLLEAQDYDKMEAIMLRTPVGKRYLKAGGYDFVDEIPYVAKYRSCKKDIRFSTHPSVVMISYVFLSEIEIIDIVNIIEGIRYGLPPAEIARLMAIPMTLEKR